MTRRPVGRPCRFPQPETRPAPRASGDYSTRSLRIAPCLAASVFKSKFQSLVVRRGYKRAIIAIGHKILRTIFFMLQRREHYRDSATDYEALSVQRNAPRWIKALTKFGFIKHANA